MRNEKLPEGFGELDESRLPRHIAIIMDGNGRWASTRGRMRAAGHRAGMERICTVVRTSSDIGIDYLTLYAFSTENWKRPRPEIELLFSLLIEYLRREIEELHRNNVRLRTIGQVQMLPKTVREEIDRAVEKTAGNRGMQLIIALNYGGRDEIIRAAGALAQKAKDGAIEPCDIDEAAFKAELFTSDIPDPELIIRTSGEKRMSNFLLFQSAYSEFVSVEANWPDFDNSAYYAALTEYFSRGRRFGGLG